MTPGNPSAVEVQGWCVHYGPAQALFDIDMRVEAGAALALLGRNGAGKSTLLKSLMGLIPHSAGRAQLRGEDIASMEPYRMARAGVAYVAQDRRIFTDLTVAENLDLGRQTRRSGCAARDGGAQWSLAEIYGLFPNLGRVKARGGGEISGGEQKMLALGRALLGNPSLLLMDEPSEGVAPLILEGFAAALQRVRARGVTIILAEQNLDFARQVCDEYLLLQHGAVGARAALVAAPGEDAAAIDAALDEVLGAALGLGRRRDVP